MSASLARLADREAADVPSNIQRHAFKNTAEEAGHGLYCCFCFVIECDHSQGNMSKNICGMESANFML